MNLSFCSGCMDSILCGFACFAQCVGGFPYFGFMFRPSGEVLFFASPKKSNQKKGGPDGLPAMRVPCASQTFGRSPNSQAGNTPGQLNQGGLTYPQKPCDARLRPREPGKVFLSTLVQPSTAGKTGLSAPPVRARSERSEIGELGARRLFRGAQGTPRHTAGVPWGQPPDRFSFGSFSLAEQRK